MPDRETLKQYRSLPLDAKVAMSYQRIREWYDYWNGNVYVAFSGGKDSTVLAHLVHEFYPDIPLVFVNTGLEFPEIQSFRSEDGWRLAELESEENLGAEQGRIGHEKGL